MSNGDLSIEGYIRELRALIGHRLLVMPGMLAIIRNADGEVLFIRRSDTGGWSLPGGMVEPGQSAYETLAREIREETSLTITEATPFGLYTHPRNTVVYPNGDEVQPFTVVFLVLKWSGELHADGNESLEVAFFAPDCVPITHALNLQILADVDTYLSSHRFAID